MATHQHDAWDTAYYYAPTFTLIRDQAGNCYCIPQEGEGTMPEVIGGEIVREDDDYHPGYAMMMANYD